MTTIRAAVEALRTSREELPEYVGADAVIRTQPAKWQADGASGAVLCTAYGTVLPPTSEVAEHIARTSSPHVVQALEQLLEAIEAMDERHSFTIQDVDLAAKELANAITRTEERS